MPRPHTRSARGVVKGEGAKPSAQSRTTKGTSPKSASAKNTSAKNTGAKSASAAEARAPVIAGFEGKASMPHPTRYQASRDELLGFYREMVLIRRFEEKAGQLYGMLKIGGFCHLYIGEEAVAVGVQSALVSGLDSVITGYRDHGHMLVNGMPPREIMAELTGRAAGVARGKGGSMHMFSVDHKFYGGHGIVGAQVPLGTGLAFAHKYLEDGGVCVTYFGDGAANQGQVYESFNMAELWGLPVIFVIENNQYAMGTSVNRASSENRLYRRGESFRVPGMQIDGMDVLTVRGAAEVATAWVRAGNGPIILEMETYRYRGHSMSDPAKYRSREEVKEVREKSDPIERLKRDLQAADVAESELEAIDKEIRGIVEDAATFACDAPEPPLDALYSDILTESVQ